MRVRVGDRELEVSGPQDFAKKEIDQFLKAAGAGGGAGAGVPSTGGGSRRDEPAPQVSGKGLSAAQFFRKAKAQSDIDRVLVAGLFLEVMREVDSFTGREVAEVIREAKSPLPINVNNAINKNIMRGYIMPSGDKDNHRAFVLTTDGKQVVEHLLKNAGG
jgi:hypothetical protein